MRVRIWLLIASLAIVSATSPAQARGPAKTFARSAMNKLFKREAARDATTAAKPLTESRTVWRYTTRKKAAQESRHGLAPGRHTTARVTPGRPPSPETAQRVYGLPRKPNVRETWRLPSGTSVKSNKVIGGAPGKGELTPTKRLPPENLMKTTPLRSSSQ